MKPIKEPMGNPVTVDFNWLDPSTSKEFSHVLVYRLINQTLR